MRRMGELLDIEEDDDELTMSPPSLESPSHSPGGVFLANRPKKPTRGSVIKLNA